jgi:hypothetical protein
LLLISFRRNTRWKTENSEFPKFIVDLVENVLLISANMCLWMLNVSRIASLGALTKTTHLVSDSSKTSSTLKP